MAKLLISLSAKSKDSPLIPGLPRPGLSRAYTGKYICRPDLIFLAVELGLVKAPKKTTVSIKQFVENSPYSDLSLAKFSMYRDLVDISVPKVLSYLKMDAGAVPIMLLSHGGKSYIMDGNHRVAAAHYAGLDKIPAYVWKYSDIAGVEVQNDKRSKPHPLIWSN